jgi:coenzyme F420-reducing hydrogenase beta subunit
MVFDVKTCSGCMACMNVCPKDAISVVESVEGFILPAIDEKKCVHCGLCEAVCDFNKDKHVGNDMRRAFSLIHLNKEVLEKSSSGGAFTALSDIILQKEGVVVGATYDREFNVVHSMAITQEERNRMRGSKYVQCNPSMAYREIKQLLGERQVIFVGTPCQCAGLKSYLKNDYDNLIVIDFLCHGVPSNKMFKEHIALISKKT